MASQTQNPTPDADENGTENGNGKKRGRKAGEHGINNPRSMEAIVAEITFNEQGLGSFKKVWGVLSAEERKWWEKYIGASKQYNVAKRRGVRLEKEKVARMNLDAGGRVAVADKVEDSLDDLFGSADA